jgi:ABC-type bacteriocin/lantibiotic exporter with double-glycine peptidase domain
MRTFLRKLFSSEKIPLKDLSYILSLFSKPQKAKLSLITIVGIGLSLLDLAGVILIGLIGSLATLGATGQEAGGITKALIGILKLSDLSRVEQISFLGVLAGVFLVSKTFISYLVQKRLAVFIQARVTDLLSRFLRSTLSWNLTTIGRIPRRQLLQSLQSGIPNLVAGVVMPTFMLVSDFALILLLSGALFFTEPMLALSTTVLFLSAATYLHFRLNTKQRKMGAELSEILLENQLNFDALIEGFREAYVRDVRENLILRIEKDRQRAGKILSEFAMVSQLGKYAFEISMVAGAAIIVAQQMLVSNSSRAVAIIGLFLAASFRIGPAVLRIQNSILNIRRALAQSDYTLRLLKDIKLENATTAEIAFKAFPEKQKLKGSAIEFIDVDFRYANEKDELISKFNFTSEFGEHIAIVGRSGVGKTTLVDLLVGALLPTKGTIKIFGLDPSQCIARFPGAISYLPQQVFLLNGTIRENICFGYDSKEVADEKIWKALSKARLDNWVKSLNGELDFVIWDHGANISGGQRQRLGLTRALLTEPQMLILDEATSALDAETQSEISSTLSELRGQLSLVMIAHRLESIGHTDKVIQVSGPRNIRIMNTDKFITL